MKTLLGFILAFGLSYPSDAEGKDERIPASVDFDRALEAAQADQAEAIQNMKPPRDLEESRDTEQALIFLEPED